MNLVLRRIDDRVVLASKLHDFFLCMRVCKVQVKEADRLVGVREGTGCRGLVLCYTQTLWGRHGGDFVFTQSHPRV